MRIVIELRRDVMPRRIVNFLLKHTALRQTFGIIMLALVNGQPRLLNLAQVIGLYLAHRKEIIVRRTRYELSQAKRRPHGEGLQIALNFLDEIIALIRAAPSGEVARSQMVERFGLTQIQAEAILNMQLRQISQLERAADRGRLQRPAQRDGAPGRHSGHARPASSRSSRRSCATCATSSATSAKRASCRPRRTRSPKTI